MVTATIPVGANPTGVAVSPDGRTVYVTNFASNTVSVITNPQPPLMCAGTPGRPNCHGQCVSSLAQKYGGINNAAAALGFPSVMALQSLLRTFAEDSGLSRSASTSLIWLNTNSSRLISRRNLRFRRPSRGCAVGTVQNSRIFHRSEGGRQRDRSRLHCPRCPTLVTATPTRLSSNDQT